MIPPNMASNLRAMQKAYCLTFHRPNERAMLVTMFRIPLSALAFPTALLAACSLDSGPPPPPAGSPMALMAQAALAGITASAVAPQFGGKVGITGPTVVEVMPRTDGLVLAELRDASGALVTTGTVSVQLSAADGQPRTVPLRYDTDLQVFEGSAGGGAAARAQQRGGHGAGRGRAAQRGDAHAGARGAGAGAYGGQVVLVGPIAPEVRVDSDGSVHAYLPEASARVCPAASCT
jgi:hypothetical protein